MLFRVVAEDGRMDFGRLRDEWRAFLLDVTGMLAFFLIVQVGGIFFAQRQPSPSGGASGVGAAAAGGAPLAQVGVGTALVYLVLFAVMTLAMLGAIKYGKTAIIKYVAYPIIYFTFLSALVLSGVPFVISLVLAAVAPTAYAKFRTWYVITGIGLVVSAVTIGAFGAIWSPAAVLVLLAVLTVYDAIAVYVTGHMQTLARGVGDKLPLFVVIPHSKSFSIEEIFDAESDERVATALGLGDLIIPSTLVAIAAQRVGDTVLTIGGLTLTAPAIGAMVGSLVGVVVLTVMLYVIENAGHAGLPPLNIGTILGYLIAGFAVGLPLTTLLGL